MKLSKIILENIRSYTKQELNFSNGITLLAGDIGSGKSSILLAIDFALFGLNKLHLPGSSLLRSGQPKGSVELYFEIENQSIIIKRTLKKTKDTVNQDSGYIIINNQKKNCTPIELKQHIIDLLNYPQDLLTKSKSMIYRYTVYTPQEEMKLILLGDKESRLEILRRIFDIDKYKRIQENTKILVTYLKSENKSRSIQIVDLDQKKSEFLELCNKENKVKQEISKLNLEKLNSDLKLEKSVLENLESETKNYTELKNKLNLLNLEIKHNTKLTEDLNLEFSTLINQIKNLESETSKKILISNIDLDSLKQIINNNELEQRNILTKLTESKYKVKSSKEIQEDIIKLDICPICKQQVTQEHIKNLIDSEKNLIQALESKISKLNLEYQNKDQEIIKIKLDLDQAKNTLSEIEKTKIKTDLLKEKNLRKKFIEENLTKTEIEKRSIAIEKSRTEKQLLNSNDLESRLSKVKEQLERIQVLYRQEEIKKFSLEKDLSFIAREQTRLSQEVAKKELIKKDLNYWSQIQFWLETHFINLMSTIEKKTMSLVHYDFNINFQKWFSLLMDDELIQVKLDNEFSPIIEQNNHDIDYIHLSGGEKTSIALSYRLALNQVINKLKSHIKTKDLIILDEPSDGFSSEQLDKLRLIFKELNIPQIILVSHESKIESIADHIIRLDKQNHVTQFSNL